MKASVTQKIKYSFLRELKVSVLLFLPLFMVFTGCIKDDDENEETINHVKVGDAVPSFTVQDGYGRRFITSDFREKRSILLFFHTGCKDCQRELPIIEAAWKEIKADPHLQLVAIGRAESKADINKYWDANGLTFSTFLDPDKSVYNLFANNTIPRIYIVDEEGKVVWMAIEKFNLTAEQLLDILKTAAI